ncbi:MAG TPA: tyrosine-type recombinase/integrase, partial [Burkholderiales bacterium]|nr:tyrosine-type recombinase/integrase [Burkholderiales bacterium]
MAAKAIWLHGQPAVRISVTVHGAIKRKCISNRQDVPTMADAERLAAWFNRLLASGRFEWTEAGLVASSDRPDKTWPFARYAAYWLDDNAALHKATTRKFHRLNLSYLLPALGTVAIGSLTRTLCRDVVKSLEKLRGRRSRQPLAMKYREGIYRTLQGILSGAVDDQLLDFNPANRLGKYLAADRRRLKTAIDPYTFAEAERFLARVQALAPAYYAFCLVLLRTGLRKGEVMELRWRDDFADHRPTQVLVQRNFTYPQYEEDRAAGLAPDQAGITTPKGNRSRYVDLSPQVVAALQAHRVAQRAAAFQAGRPVPELVFTGPDGSRIIPGNILRRVFPAVCTATRDDLPPPVRVVTLHTLRHTFVTQM